MLPKSKANKASVSSVSDSPTPTQLALRQAAEQLFLERGFKATPVSAIVQQAGVAQGTFYLYYKTKSAILDDLRRQMVYRYTTTLRQVAQTSAPADERLTRVVLAMADVVKLNLPLERMFRFAETGEASALAIVQGRKRLGALAASLLAEINPQMSEADVAGLGAIIVGLYDQVLFEALAFDDQPDRAVRLALRFTLCGIGVNIDRVNVLLKLAKT